MTKIKDVLAGNVSHIQTRQFKDIDHSAMAYMLGKNKTLHGVLDRLTVLNEQDPKAMIMFMKDFNVKDLKGLAGELMEYYQNHPEKVDRFKSLMDVDPRSYGKQKK